MNVELILNGRRVVLEARIDEMLLPVLRREGLLSVVAVLSSLRLGMSHIRARRREPNARLHME